MKSFAKTSLSFVLMIAILTALAGLGCGGGSASSSSSSQGPTPSAAVLVNLGDSPSDQVMAMSLTVSSMSFMNSSGASVTAMNSPVTLEMMHLMGTMQSIAMPKLPQGTYTQISVTISSATVTYLDPVAHNLVQKTVPGPMGVNITLNPALTVGTSAMVMNLDMDVAHSISIDSSGNVTMTPTFRAFANSAMSNATDPEHGRMLHMIGTTGNISGNNFTMTTLSGMQFNMVSSGSTQFQGMGGMNSMGSGMILFVDAMMQPDGSINADYIQDMMNSGGSMVLGTISAVTGSPATQLSLVPMDGIGSGMMSSVLAEGMTITVGSGTAYTIDTDNVDMHGLSFTPTFDSTHIFSGQMVSTVSSSSMMSGGMMGGGAQTASAVQLEPQGFTGTVTNYTAGSGAATFTLTLAPTSVFATLTGSTTLTVFQQAETQLRDMTSVVNGANVHVRGLLFLDSGTYKLIATRITGAQ